MTTNELLEMQMLAASLAEEYKRTLAEIREKCHHPEEHIVEKQYYFSGSYYDTAYTDKWRECTICGAKSETTHVDHSWYG